MHSPIDKEMAMEEFASQLLEDDSPETVRVFMKRYPEYSEDILGYAVALLMNKHSTDEPFLNTEERANFIERATEVFRKATESKPTQFSSLLKRVTQIGLNADQFKEKTGVSSFVLLNLDQKVVDVASIPSRILNSISETLAIPGDVLNNYISGGVSPGQAMNYKASAAPVSTKRIPFEEVLRQDTSLSEEERRKLME